MTLNGVQKTNLGVTWALGGIATATFFMRIYVRFFLQRNPGYDDYAMIISWGLAIASAGLATAAVHYGLGVDIYDIHDPNYKLNALKYLTLAPSPSILSVGFGKLSIVLMFRRLLGLAMTKKLSVVLWILIAITGCLSVAAVVIVLGFCTPTAAIWDTSITPVRCMAKDTQLGVGLAQASFNAFTDLVLGLLPAYSFWNLQMPLRRKVGLTLLFGVGVFGCIITSIKAYQLRNITGHDNLTQSWSPITIWNTAEMFVVISSANIPMIRSLLRRVANIESSANNSYPLQSTSKSRSLVGKINNKYFSIENGYNTENSVSVSRETGRDDVDRVYPLTRNDSPPDAPDDASSDQGIVKKTVFTVNYGQKS